MDIQMPEMDGYEATRHIKKIDKDITIIALSANAMKDDIRKSKEAGMAEHLNKPIDVEKLYSTLLKYITKKCDVAKTVDSEDKKIDETEDELPDFSYIDKDKALKMVLNNQKIYVNILKGLYEFKDVKLETMSDEEFKRTIHTIKGISASAGAFKLNEVAIELNKTLDKNLLGSFYHELKLVIDEIEEKIVGGEESAKKMDIEPDKAKELFEKLKAAIATKRAKNTRPIIAEIDKYNLSPEDEKVFEEIKVLLGRYKFKAAGELL